jgi:FkbM family methyltransferase
MMTMNATGMLRKLALMKFCWQTGGDAASRWRLARAFCRLAGDHQKFHSDERMEIRGCVGDGRPLRLTIRDQADDVIVFREIFFDREYRACTDLGFEPTAIYDIGADVGLAAAYFRSRWPEAVIVGFEADEKDFAVAERNYARLGAARLFPVAAGNYDSDCSTADDFEDGSDEVTVTVRVRRLDSMIQRCELPRPDLIKIDVEGHALEVLDGLGDCLAQARGVLLETHTQASYDAGVARLREAGFSVEDELERGDVARVLVARRQQVV